MGDLMRQSASPFMFRSGDRDDLLRAIQAAIRTDRRDAAARGRAVAERHGTWDDAIARQTSVYQAMCGTVYGLAERSRGPAGARAVLHACNAPVTSAQYPADRVVGNSAEPSPQEA
jgi:hypothetical protein